MSDDTAPSRSGQVDDRLPLLDDQGAVKQADGIVDRPQAPTVRMATPCLIRRAMGCHRRRFLGSRS